MFLHLNHSNRKLTCSIMKQCSDNNANDENDISSDNIDESNDNLIF